MNPILKPVSLLALSAAMLGQTAQAQETKQVLPKLPVDDVKVDWIAPPKPDSPAPARPVTVEMNAATLKDVPQPPKATFTRRIERVHYDEPGDGRVWAMGGNYKLSAGAEGVTFVPYFGSAAPMSHPIRFRLAGVSLGGTELGLRAEPVPAREATSVALSHGALVERWHLGLDRVEQTFVFESLPFAADLDLRIDVETTLELSDVDSGLEFAGELGRVAYGDVTVVDGAGRTLAVPSRIVDGDIVLGVPGWFVAAAKMPLVVDPVIANFFIDLTRDAYTADTAYDASTDRWLVSMEETFTATDHDVWGATLDGAGNLVSGGGAYIDFTTTTWRDPMCANNNIADQFLVVAARGPDGSREIWGRTREAGTAGMGTQIAISGGSSGEKHSPDVGGDPVTAGPTYYCVVWQREFSATDTDVHYQLVRTNSTLLFPSDQLVDNSGATLDFSPEVSKSNGIAPFSTQRWNVTFNRVFSPSDRDIRGAQILWDGTLVTSSFSVDFSGLDHLWPMPSSPLDSPYGERDWACVYQSNEGSDWDIRMSAFRKDSLVRRDNVTALEGAITSGFVNQEQGGPSITADGAQYLVSYHELFSTSTVDWDIYCATLRHDAANITVLEAHRNLAFSGAPETWPRMTSGRDALGGPGRFCVAWHQGSGATGANDVEGVLFDVIPDWANVGEVDCTGGTPNSTGETAALRILGSASRSANRILFDVHALPGNSFGYFSMGRFTGSVPVGQGTFCLGNPYQRLSLFTLNSGSANAVSLQFDLNILPPHTAVSGGQTWRFQYWYRDQNPGVTSNLSNAVRIAFVN